MRRVAIRASMGVEFLSGLGDDLENIAVLR